MKHKINPMIDCVFKAILGSEEHKGLLIHFLNAVLIPTGSIPIKKVDLLNPFNLKEFMTDKLTIVDVKAEDEQNTKYQIEVHLSGESDRAKHILYTWSTIYQNQLKESESFNDLNPVISIWLLGSKLIKESELFAHHFYAYDPVNKIYLNRDLNIHILEVSKWNKGNSIDDEQDRWMYFFKEGKNIDIDTPPGCLLTKEMEEAMSVLKKFSEKELEYDIYQNRLRAIRVQKSLEQERDEAVQNWMMLNKNWIN
jgi:predicted transposase/invertase (TIGR01784 family)